MTFGIMQHLNVTVCQDADEAMKQGYHSWADGKYVGTLPISIDEVVIVKNGTEGNNHTVDLILKDESGKKYVVMVTGRLLKSLPL